MDARDLEQRRQQIFQFDERTMTLSWEGEDDELITVPAMYVVCALCDGTGKHVNPSIDANGLTSEDFAEDPDFAEDYRRGTYDVSCYRCHGARVSPSVAEHASEAQQLAYDNRVSAEYADLREQANEERWGY